MRIYIAGPMRGIEKWNFPAFDEARDALREQGYEVVSPADLDREHGLFPEGLDGRDLRAMEERGWQDVPGWFDLKAAMARDLREMEKCDGVALLDGWDDSEGVQKELERARQKGISVYSVADWRDMAYGFWEPPAEPEWPALPEGMPEPPAGYTFIGLRSYSEEPVWRLMLWAHPVLGDEWDAEICAEIPPTDTLLYAVRNDDLRLITRIAR